MSDVCDKKKLIYLKLDQIAIVKYPFVIIVQLMFLPTIFCKAINARGIYSVIPTLKVGIGHIDSRHAGSRMAQEKGGRETERKREVDR